MRGQFFKYWNRVRSGFWFLPASMAGAAVALALVSVTLDEPMTEWLALNLGWTFTGGAEGASAVLSIVAGSMITIAGPEDLTTLLRQAEMIARGAMEALPEREDRRVVEERCQAVIQLCSEAAASCR